MTAQTAITEVAMDLTGDGIMAVAAIFVAVCLARFVLRARQGRGFGG